MPTNWDNLAIQDATEEQFNAILPKQAGKGMNPQLVAVLDAVEAGGIKEIRVPDASQLRGLRVALGRGAAQRGFKLEYRSDGPRLYVRKSDEPLKPQVARHEASAGNGRKTRGRPRKQAADNASLLTEGMSETLE